MTLILDETNFAVAAESTVGGAQFYSALKQAAQQAVGGIFNGTVIPIEYPQQGDFQWFFRSQNQTFNAGTFDYISANVSPGTVPGTAALSPSGGFPNQYVQVISKIEYMLSSADRNAVNEQQTLADTQKQTLIANYQAIYGPITPAQMAAARAAIGAPTTREDYIISYEMGYIWSGHEAAGKPPLSYTEMARARNLRALLPKAPPSADRVITDATNYLGILRPVTTILSNEQQGKWILAELVENTRNPSTENGGMLLQDPVDGTVLPPNVGYGLGSASVASIQNDLRNTGRTITLGMQTSAASNDQLNVSVQGQAGIRVGSFLRFSVAGGGSFNMSTAAGTSASASVSMTWAGYSIVPISPRAWQQATNIGWYYADPIATAVKTGNQDVTNFKFVAPVGVNLKPLAQGGNFGYPTTLLIANYPTVKITYTNADFRTFQRNWSEHVSGNLSLFGWISLGSFSQGAYSSKVEASSNNSSFTVTFSASPKVAELPMMQQQAYVIGGAFANPGAVK